MKKRILFLRIVVIVIIALEIIVIAGGVIVNNVIDINSSYDSIKTAYVINHIPFNNFLFSNSEASFIYEAINNKISEYPKTVPDFIDLPVDSIIDAIDTNERIHIEYEDDDNYENGVVTAQEPAAGAAWDDGVIVNLTVNRKYSDINSLCLRGNIGESSGKLYLLATSYGTAAKGTIWADGEKLADGDITRLYADNGNVYYIDRNGMNKLGTEGISQVLAKDLFDNTVIFDGKLYYMDKEKDGDWYCYNTNDKTNSHVIANEPIIFLYVNSDYIVCHGPNDIIVLDSKSYRAIKRMHYENNVIDCSLDKDKVYLIETEYINNTKGLFKEKFILTKYNIKQDTQTTVVESNENEYEGIFDVSAVDDKIIFKQYSDKRNGFRYIDMKTMENKFFTVKTHGIFDELFDGQRIVYKTEGQTFYSISIFTGETKKIDIIS